MKESLDQRRARFAWDKVQGRSSEYTRLAKGAPALIMQAGLMPVLAFYRDKGKEKEHKPKTHHDLLLEHLCEWLHKQFQERITNAAFPTVMKALMGDSSGDAAEYARFYQQATEETMALLRWIRQFAAAVTGGEDNGGHHA